jgi:hypothetical protein
MSGFYLVTRGITSHHLFKGNPQRLAVWLWLLDNAAWKPTTHDVKGHTIEVPRGAVCASERHIADECGVGYQVVRTALKRFQSERMINATVTHGKTVITLCNYDKHQSPERVDNAEGNATLTQHQRNPNAQKKQGNKETREEPNGSSMRATRLPPDWQLPREWAEWAFSQGMDELSSRREGERFRDYWVSTPGQRGVKLDWQATWRNWVRRWLDERATRAPPPGAVPPRPRIRARLPEEYQ